MDSLCAGKLHNLATGTKTKALEDQRILYSAAQEGNFHSTKIINGFLHETEHISLLYLLEFVT